MRNSFKLRMAVELGKIILLGQRKPLLVSWKITNSCNLRCRYCASYGDSSDEMSEELICSSITVLKAMGTRMIRFTGGEPLLREDLPRVVRHCTELGILVGLASNGILFPRMVQDLMPLSNVSFSLDGPEAIHDALRGKGAYQAVIQAVEKAKGMGLNTNLSVTLSRENISQVETILSLAARLGVKAFFQPATMRVQCSEKGEDLTPDVNLYREAIAQLIKCKPKNRHIGNSTLALKHLLCWPQRTPVNCFAGKIICRINHNGDVLACPRFKGVTGLYNLKSQDIRSCFNSLSAPHCGECWCGMFLELNLLSSMYPTAILDAILR